MTWSDRPPWTLPCAEKDPEATCDLRLHTYPSTWMIGKDTAP